MPAWIFKIQVRITIYRSKQKKSTTEHLIWLRNTGVIAKNRNGPKSGWLTVNRFVSVKAKIVSIAELWCWLVDAAPVLPPVTSTDYWPVTSHAPLTPTVGCKMQSIGHDFWGVIITLLRVVITASVSRMSSCQISFGRDEDEDTEAEETVRNWVPDHRSFQVTCVMCHE